MCQQGERAGQGWNKRLKLIPAEQGHLSETNTGCACGSRRIYRQMLPQPTCPLWFARGKSEMRVWDSVCSVNAATLICSGVSSVLQTSVLPAGTQSMTWKAKTLIMQGASWSPGDKSDFMGGRGEKNKRCNKNTYPYFPNRKRIFKKINIFVPSNRDQEHKTRR